MPSFKAVQRGYGNLWRQATLDQVRVEEISRVAAGIITSKERYRQVERQTSVPWFWIACVHYRESTNRFNGVLHNGEAIIGTGRKTRLVPAGRGPFETWEDAAIDALRGKGLHRIAEWPVERCLYEFERYNGWGYFGREASPYVWAGTSLSDERGKYVADHVFDPDAPEKQLGCAAILKDLVERDAEIYHTLFGGFDVPAEPEPARPELEPTAPSQSDTDMGALLRLIDAAPEGAEISVCVKLKKKGFLNPPRPSDAGRAQTVKGQIMFPTFPNKKTMGVAIIVAFIGVAEGLFGWDIPGVVVGEDWLQYIIAGAGLGSIRAAMGKVIDAFSGK